MKDAEIKLRLSAEVKARLKQAADEAGLSLSEYILKRCDPSCSPAGRAAPLPAPEKIVALGASQEVAEPKPVSLRRPPPREPPTPPADFDKVPVPVTPEKRPPSRFEGLVPTKAELEAETERIRQQNRDARISKGSQ